VHVIDVSNPFWRRQREAVEGLLAQLGAGGKPAIIAWNKSDLVSDARPGEGVAVSAKTGAGLMDLRSALQQALHGTQKEIIA